LHYKHDTLIFTLASSAIRERKARAMEVRPKPRSIEAKGEESGSYARGEEKPDSDIDVLVEFTQRKSLLEIIRIERELSDTLGVKVDLLTEKSISPYLIDRVRNEMQVIEG
jgi:predicted nucleotidyltransferase